METLLSDYQKIFSFTDDESFKGFTQEHLFIKGFIKKAWGQDIAAMSNMAETMLNLHRSGVDTTLLQHAMSVIVDRTINFCDSPYKRAIETYENLGPNGYYLEHLNIILGCAYAIGIKEYTQLYTKISQHLHDISVNQKNAHAPLMAYPKMRWSADQSAIIYSLWLYDKNMGTSLHQLPAQNWITYMQKNRRDKSTGLFMTEVMGHKWYSNMPRGCSLAYLCYYTSHFAPDIATEQWGLFKQHMTSNFIGMKAFKEFLPHQKGRWTPDSGPIIFGTGVAATGLGLKAAAALSDTETFNTLSASVSKMMKFCSLFRKIPGVRKLSRIGDDILSNSIALQAQSRFKLNATAI